MLSEYFYTWEIHTIKHWLSSFKCQTFYTLVVFQIQYWFECLCCLLSKHFWKFCHSLSVRNFDRHVERPSAVVSQIKRKVIITFQFNWKQKRFHFYLWFNLNWQSCKVNIGRIVIKMKKNYFYRKAIITRIVLLMLKKGY